MNNDNDLNLHSMTKLSGWLRYWLGFTLIRIISQCDVVFCSFWEKYGIYFVLTVYGKFLCTVNLRLAYS